MSSSPHGKIVCADCNQAYRWLPELAGKKVRCKCDGVMLFPDAGPGKGKAVRAGMKSHGNGKPKPAAAPRPAAGAGEPSSSDSTSSVAASQSGSPVAGGSSSGIVTQASSSSSLPLDDDFDLDLNLGSGEIPSAGDMIDIRAAEDAPPPTGDAPVIAAEPAANTCPSCKATLKPGAVLCVQCGFNLKKGKLTTSKVGGGADDNASGVPGGSTGGLFARLTRGLRRKS